MARGRLELRARSYHLDDVPLRAGDRIELQLANGKWLEGEYAWSGSVARWPGLRVHLAAKVGGSPRAAAVMAFNPEEALVRWSGAAPTDRTPDPPSGPLFVVHDDD